MTVNAIDEQEVEYEDDTQHLLDEINSTGMLKYRTFNMRNHRNKMFE